MSPHVGKLRGVTIASVTKPFLVFIKRIGMALRMLLRTESLIGGQALVLCSRTLKILFNSGRGPALEILTSPSMIILCYFQNTEGRFWFLTQHCSTKEYWGVNPRHQKVECISRSSCCCLDVGCFHKGPCIKALVPRELLEGSGNLKRWEEVRPLEGCSWRNGGDLDSSFPICFPGSWSKLVLLYHVAHVMFYLATSSKEVEPTSDQLTSPSCESKCMFTFFEWVITGF